jgi:glycosyltransferase involved in cell wall biosynthesis
MSMGTPVVLSRTLGISDYILDQETGRYASPGCFQELRDTVLALWDSPAERKRLGANARQAVEETMNLDHYASSVVRIVENARSR